MVEYLIYKYLIIIIEIKNWNYLGMSLLASGYFQFQDKAYSFTSLGM